MTDTALSKSAKVKEKFRYIMEIVTIEPIICFYLIATNMRGPVINNLLLEMACRVNEGYNNTVCQAIITSTHEQNNFTKENGVVQEHISGMLSWCQPIQSVIPVILLLFLGTYSDRHKIRKPFLLIPIFGQFISTICCILCVIFKERWPVESVGIAKYVISSIFGSSPMIYMAAFAYVADVSTPEMRIIRLAILQICSNISNPIGMTFSGLLFDYIGYMPLLLLSLVILTITFLYGLLVVKEPKEQKQEKEESNTWSMIGDIINFQHVKETLSLLTNTKNGQLMNIIFVLVVNFIIVTVGSGEKSVLFWFTQQTYQWKNTDFAFFTAARSAINFIALAVAVPLFLKIFHLHDITVILISLLNKIISNIICLVIRSPLGLHIGTIAGVLTILGSSGVRSQSTKCVSEDDMGKTQSLLLIIEAIATSIATQLYIQVYSYTREIYSQAFFFNGVVLCALGFIIVVIWKCLIGRKQAPVEEEADDEYKKSIEDTILCS